MTNSKYFSGARYLRTLWIAGLFAVVCGFGVDTALAEKDSDSVQKSVDKTGQGFGELLKGMGQEVKKVIGSDDKAAEKDKKEAKKHPENEPDRSKENAK